MITLTTGQLETWLAQVLWPFVRIGACFMVAPAFGAVFVPARIRIVLAGAVTLAISPLLPPPAAIVPFSAAGLLVTVQQLLIGVALGFSLQLLFDAVTLGGQLLANSMGLSFAFNIDPLRGEEVPALGQFYTILVMLTFMALNGHLVLIEVLVDGFRTLPVGTDGLGQDGLWTLVEWGSQLFVGALSIALPGVTALLIVNVAFGVMSRAAPQLNLFAVGFPISLVFGLVIVLAGMPAVQTTFTHLLGDGFELLRKLTVAGG
ncbi:MAG TPA: flagellar biosynthetic protein FliR [Steroidobacteraceae bacterium]|nr:flagellar biosynthetic protein FliR [Steroidobacteraceae bacterium]